MDSNFMHCCISSNKDRKRRYDFFSRLLFHLSGFLPPRQTVALQEHTLFENHQKCLILHTNLNNLGQTRKLKNIESGGFNLISSNETFTSNFYPLCLCRILRFFAGQTVALQLAELVYDAIWVSTL